MVKLFCHRPIVVKKRVGKETSLSKNCNTLLRVKGFNDKTQRWITEEGYMANIFYPWAKRESLKPSPKVAFPI